MAGYGAADSPGDRGLGPTIDWPKALRITVTFQDPELRFHEQHLLAPNDVPDGRTFQWIFSLPQPAF